MRNILKLGIFIGAMLTASAAFGQGSISSSGGLQASDTSSAQPARMHPSPETPNIMVVGENDGENVAGNHFVNWSDAVALGRQQKHELKNPPSLGDIARKYRAEKAQPQTKSSL